MIDLSAIRNYKLRSLLKASAKFRALPKEEQKRQIERMKNLPAAQQEKLCIFFAEENRKEREQNNGLTNEEKLEILKKLYGELVALEKKFTGLLKKEPEVKTRKHEKAKIDSLLSKINNS